MDRLSDLMGKVLSRRGLKDQAQASHVVYLAQVWIEERIPTVSAYLKVKSLRDGILSIESSHAIASQELKQQAQALLQHLRDSVDVPISDIAIQRSREAVE